MTVSERLRTIRHTIFEQFEAAKTPKAVFELQSAIATEIRKSEQAAKKDETGEYKWHIHQLRCYGDAIAWQLLSPHAIRQLAKNPAHPPSLTGQGRSFEGTLKLAQEHAEDDIPLIISDITNCIKIGDIINCYDPERPMIVECKGKLKPEQLMQGRTGRQLSRAMKITEYLYKGKARLYGEEQISIIFETSIEPKFSGKAVNQAVKSALFSGEGIGIISNCDLVWAYSADREYPEEPLPIRNLTSKFKMGCLGCHARVVQEANLIIPPPAVWAIDSDCRFALMELDVILMHFIDVHRFTEVKSKYGRVTEVLSDKTGIVGFLVEANGRKYQLSARFLEDVLYGFHTIESTAKLMIDFAKQRSEFESSPIYKELGFIDKPTRKPKVHFIRNEAEDAQLLKEAHTLSPEDIVAMPQTLYNNLLRKSASKAQKDKNK